MSNGFEAVTGSYSLFNFSRETITDFYHVIALRANQVMTMRDIPRPRQTVTCRAASKMESLNNPHALQQIH